MNDSTEGGSRRSPAFTPAIDVSQFQAVDIRSGTIQRCEPFPEARKPAYRMWIDFGSELGVRQTSAQVTQAYTPQQLVGRTVLAVVNLPPRQIGPCRSEVLVLGIPDGNGVIRLLQAEGVIPDGHRVS